MHMILKPALAIFLIIGGTARSANQAGLAPCVDVKVSRSIRKKKIIYSYRVKNACKQPMTGFWIGTTKLSGDSHFELTELPVGWSYDATTQKMEAQAPRSWRVDVITEEESEFHAIRWSCSQPQSSLRPGESLDGLTVTIAKADQQHEKGHWMANFDDGSLRSGWLSNSPP